MPAEGAESLCALHSCVLVGHRDAWYNSRVLTPVDWFWMSILIPFLCNTFGTFTTEHDCSHSRAGCGLLMSIYDTQHHKRTRSTMERNTNWGSYERRHSWSPLLNSITSIVNGGNEMARIRDNCNEAMCLQLQAPALYLASVTAARNVLAARGCDTLLRLVEHPRLKSETPGLSPIINSGRRFSGPTIPNALSAHQVFAPPKYSVQYRS